MHDQTPIVTVTPNPALDRATSAPEVTPGPKLRCLTPRTDPGGGGINVARVVRLLGGHATVVTVLGGRTGEELAGLLRAAGLATRVVPCGEETRESLTVDDRSRSEQYRFVLPGPTLTPHEVRSLLETSLDAVVPGTLVVGSGSLPRGLDRGFWADLARGVSETGARLLLDSSDPSAALDVGVWLFRSNDREMSALAGRDLGRGAEAEAFCRELIEAGRAEVVLMGLGAEGSLLVAADQTVRVPAPEVAKRSAVGAGDSVMGGTVLGLARGWTLEQAVTFGVVAGAAAHATPGTELCRPDDVERLYREQTGQPLPS